MTISVDDALQNQNRWRSLRVGTAAPVLQFFADYSPESWWHSRFLPSQHEARQKLVTGFLSRHGFQTQINLAVIAANPSFVLFHKRTITSAVYEEAIGSYPHVHPLFVVPDPRMISENPTLPLPEWVGMVRDCREGKCTLVVESKPAMAGLARLGARQIRYLPPLVQLPANFRVEGKSVSDYYRIILCAESYPNLDLLSVLMGISSWRNPSDKPVRLVLSLGEGFESTQENYRKGLIDAARLLFESVDVWPTYPRTRFLRRMARDVDVLVDPAPQSSVALEAGLLKIPTYAYVNGQVVPSPGLKAEELRAQTDIGDDRKSFWTGLVRGN